MISVAKTTSGWHIRQDENELGYYSSLPEAMDVAYAEERKTTRDGRVEQRDPSGYDGGSPQSDCLLERR